jgi:glycosyltransferase involved in cell wall biosynthesis
MPQSKLKRTGDILYVGVVTRYKGVRELVERAIGNGSVRLQIIGDGAELPAIRKIIEKQRADDRVIIHGKMQRADVFRAYRRARVVVLPSVGPENAPLVVMEALSTGTPVLATRIGGIPEILDKVDQRLSMDREEIMAGLGQLDWVDNLRERSIQAWERFYSPEVFLRRYLQAILN